MTYTPQVDKSHYGKRYRSQDRWNSYFHQLAFVDRVKPQTVLEIGPGEGVVTREMRSVGINVTTFDIAADLLPDVVGSVTDMALSDNSYDVVMACEVLEHIRFEDVATALTEIARVSKRHVIISLPHPERTFLSAPVLVLGGKRFDVRIQLPFFNKKHEFDGQHYWEIGKSGFPVERFVQAAASAGLQLVTTEKFADVPVHRFFLFEKRV